MDCLLRAGQIEADLQGESGERQSHKEALGAAFRACRIFGADKAEGPFFSQGPALSSWAWGLGTWVPHWREKMKETFSNTSKHKTDTIFSVRYASQSELTPILPFLVFALLAT